MAINMTILPCLTIIFLIPGLWLLITGVRPRRQGDEPRCKRCDYNLTGLPDESDRCPECGVALSLRTVVRGQRPRRRARVVFGVVCLLLAASPLVVPLSQIDWNRLKPTSWLAADVKPPSKPGWRAPWKEIIRREDAGGLSDSARRHVIAACLAEQALPGGTTIRRELVDYLGRCVDNDWLTGPEFDQFCRQASQLSIAVRQGAPSGVDIPYRIKHRSRIPRGYSLTVEQQRAACNGQTLPGHRGDTLSSSGVSGGGSFGSSLRDLPVGQHVLTAEVHAQVFRGSLSDRPDRTLIDERVHVLSTTFEVVPPDQEKAVTPINDPNLAATLQSLIHIKDGAFDPPRLRFGVEIDPGVPVPLAFSAFLRLPEREFPFDTLTWRGGPGSYSTSFHDHLDTRDLPETVDIILRSDPNALRRTVDQYEYWDGELIYEDVPVKEKDEG